MHEEVEAEAVDSLVADAVADAVVEVVAVAVVVVVLDQILKRNKARLDLVIHLPYLPHKVQMDMVAEIQILVAAVAAH